MLPHGATVMIQAHAQYRAVFIGVARRLKAEHNATIHLYVGTAQQKAHYERLNGEGLFASIVVANVLYAAVRESPSPLPDQAAEANANEAWLGVTYNELSVSDRHLGRGYALGGYRHPRSRLSEETGYDTLLHGYNRAVAFWRKEFDEKKPALLINGHKVAMVIARRLGVPTRMLAGARYKQYYYWAVNEYLENPRIAENFRKVNATTPAQIDRPYDDHLEWRKVFRYQTRFSTFAKEIVTRTAWHAYWRLRGYEKAKAYYLGDELNLFYGIWRDARRLRRMTVPLASVRAARFAYYPLHMEPETALQGISPECFAQLATIASIARDLPAGVLLAVKEAPAAVGKRPADFYGQIREFKNVVLLDTYEHGLEVVKKCAVVLTITGTGGYEGAVLGKPVIAFGRHNIYNFLPHVRVVTDLGSMREQLAYALDKDFDHEQAKSDGARFLAATIASSFELTGFTSRAPDAIGDDAIAAAYRSLVDGLQAAR